MSDVIQSTRKISGVFEKAGYFVQNVLYDGIINSGNVFVWCSFAGNNWSVGWSYFKNVGYLRDLLSIMSVFCIYVYIYIFLNYLFT